MLGWLRAEAARASRTKRTRWTSSDEPIGRKDLDRHVAAEAGVAGAVDLAHPAGPDRAQDLVRPEPRSGCERHG